MKKDYKVSRGLYARVLNNRLVVFHRLWRAHSDAFVRTVKKAILTKKGIRSVIERKRRSIGGWNATYHKSYVQFGCQRIAMENVRRLSRLLHH